MNKRLLRWLSLGGALLFSISFSLASTSELPDFGDSSLTHYQDGTEQRIALIIKRELHKAPLIMDPSISYDIQRIAKKITPYHFKPGQPFDIYIIVDNDINAFAAPGGIIGINTGLLLAAKSEEEVASVLAHEVAHQTQHHLARSMEQQSQMSIPTAAAALGSIALAALNPQAGQAALTTTMAGFSQAQLNYTRSMEAEADHLGLKLLSGADYNVTAFADFLEQLENDERYNHGDQVSTYLRTHPLPRDRISEVRQRASLYPIIPSKPALPYLLLQAKIHFLTTPTQQVLSYYEQFKNSKDPNRQMAARYAIALALIKQHQIDRAASHIQYLKMKNVTNLSLIELYADYAMATQHPEEGLTFYATALRQRPEHYPLLLVYLHALLDQRQARTALTVLRRHRAYRSEEYILLKAKIEAEAGFPAEAYMTQASFAMKLGNVFLAKKLVMAGLAIPNQSQQTREQLQAKLNEFKAKEDASPLQRERPSRNDG